MCSKLNSALTVSKSMVYITFCIKRLNGLFKFRYKCYDTLQLSKS